MFTFPFMTKGHILRRRIFQRADCAIRHLEAANAARGCLRAVTWNTNARSTWVTTIITSSRITIIAGFSGTNWVTAITAGSATGAKTGNVLKKISGVAAGNGKEEKGYTHQKDHNPGM